MYSIVTLDPVNNEEEVEIMEIFKNVSYFANKIEFFHSYDDHIHNITLDMTITNCRWREIVFHSSILNFHFRIFLKNWILNRIWQESGKKRESKLVKINGIEIINPDAGCCLSCWDPIEKRYIKIQTIEEKIIIFIPLLFPSHRVGWIETCL